MGWMLPRTPVNTQIGPALRAVEIGKIRNMRGRSAGRMSAVLTDAT
jgi:hypothetical protein